MAEKTQAQLLKEIDQEDYTLEERSAHLEDWQKEAIRWAANLPAEQVKQDRRLDESKEQTRIPTEMLQEMRAERRQNEAARAE